MEKKKAEEKNVFGSFDTADSGPELLVNKLVCFLHDHHALQ